MIDQLILTYREILWQEVKELPSLYIYIFIFELFLKSFGTHLWYIKYSDQIQIICTQLYGFKYL